MSTLADFGKRYEAMLQSHLTGIDEQALGEAYELGRFAVASGIGILDVLEIHHEACQRSCPSQGTEENQAIQARAHALLSECLAPFEVAYRGFRDANAHLQQAHWEQQFLATTTLTLHSSLNIDQCAQNIVRQAAPLGRACFVELFEGGDSPRIFSSDPSRIPARSTSDDWLYQDLKTARCTFGRLAFLKDEQTEHRLSLIERFAVRASAALDNAYLYRDAREATRAREDMLNVVSHDLKNPLSAISLNSELLLRCLEKDLQVDSLMQAAQRIKFSAARMKNLIEDVLDLARIDSNRMVLIPKERTVAALVEEAVALMSPIAQNKKIQLITQLECADIMIHCDPNRVLQVFSNLIGNAIKFTQAGGTISVRARRIDGYILFSVVDTGAGIRPEDIPHVFDRLWQARPTHSAGIGFGLFIARAIIEAHGGEICPDSVPGEGTTFFFTLPLPRAPALRATGS